jgi:hypothetical protein
MLQRGTFHPIGTNGQIHVEGVARLNDPLSSLVENSEAAVAILEGDTNENCFFAQWAIVET